MKTVGNMSIQALALCCLLAASWNAAADDLVPETDSAPVLTETGQASGAESGNVDTVSMRRGSMLPSLATGIAWPLVLAVLALAAVNSRKPRTGRRTNTRHWR